MSDRQMLKISAKAILDRSGDLVSPGCRQEVTGGDQQPDAVVGAKCSAEFAVIAASPRLVEETVSLVQRCQPEPGGDPAAATRACLEGIIQGKRREINTEVADGRIRAYCSKAFADQPDGVSACKEFGEEYVKQEADLTSTHGYDAADHFTAAVDRLVLEVTEDDDPRRRSLVALSVKNAATIYHLGHQYAAQGRAKAKTFVEAIEFASTRYKVAQAEAARKAPIGPPKAPTSQPTPEVANPPAAPEPAPAPVKSAERLAKETSVYATCEALLIKYSLTNHPVVLALQAILPPLGRKYFDPYIRLQLKNWVEGIEDATLERALPPVILGQAIDAMARAIPDRRANEIAALHYAALKIIPIGPNIDLIYSGVLDTFTYQGQPLPFAALPDVVKPYAEVLVDVAQWVTLTTKDLSQATLPAREQFNQAQRWLLNAVELLGYPSADALKVGVESGLKTLTK